MVCSNLGLFLIPVFVGPSVIMESRSGGEMASFLAFFEMNEVRRAGNKHVDAST
jgi:hypothetical protein